MKKITLFFCLILSLVAFLGPVFGEAEEDSFIYVVAYPESGPQIWQVSSSGAPAVLIYELAKGPDRIVRNLFPFEERAVLQYVSRKYFNFGNFLNPDYLPVEPFIGELQLATAGNRLLWTETDCYRIATRCYGVFRVVTLDLETLRSEILFRIPAHSYVGTPVNFYQNSIGEIPVLSPDGRYVAIMYKSDFQSEVLIIDAVTGAIKKFEDSLQSFGPAAWNLSSDAVAWPFLNPKDFGGGYVRVCRLNSGVCEDRKLEGLWIGGGDLWWGNEAETLLFIGQDHDFTMRSAGGAALYSLNWKMGRVERIPIEVEGYLSRIKVSPTGSFLAISHRKNRDTLSGEILVWDLVAGKVISRFSIENGYQYWTWSHDGRSILFLNDMPLAKERMGVLDIEAGTVYSFLPDRLNVEIVGYLTK